MVTGIDWSAELRRYAAPLVLLVAATLGALAIRALRKDDPPAAKEPAVAAAPRPPVKRPVARVYVVEYGDTLGQIAEQYETTVERLRAINPDADPTALRVGQRIRVPAAPR